VNASSYLDGLPFPADDFQRSAARAIDEGSSVVVSAPTGSGKTVVAEAAIARAIGLGRRAIYTTPIKALSNQKFGDFRRVHGDNAVGLLTGDNTINPGASIVVMTTEVLRNMMYADSADLRAVGVVVLDEVHYLQDRQRGAVWEEIIIHLDPAIPLVCLSATVANAREFADWIGERRGRTELIASDERPVPLESLYLLRDTWDRGQLRLHPLFHGSRPNERLARTLRSGGGRRYAAPRRYETAELLRRAGLLPAIYFIFSRAGCDAAVDTVVERGLDLASPSDRSRIREVASQRLAHLNPSDLAVIGHDRWLRGLAAGVAAHHAGLVPAMKETVEELFAAGLVRLVFATETLALGINMPARSVVLESLSKFTGEGHELLQPGDYTQLTGRAGRRGIDTEGTAVVLHSPYVELDRAVAIAARGSHPLRSSFRPTYNMAVNLIARYDRPTAEALLDASFARYSETRRSREARDRLAADEERLSDLRARAERAGEDVWAEAREPAPSPSAAVAELTRSLVPGDVLDGVSRSAPEARHAVVARAWGSHPRLVTVDESGAMHRLATTRLPISVSVLGRIDLPTPRRTRDPAFRKQVTDTLRAFEPVAGERRSVEQARPGPDDAAALDAARRALRLEARMERDRSALDTSGGGLVRRLDALVTVLGDHGYVDGWSLTDKGQRLRRLYNELDLVVSEALDDGLFLDLDGPSTAAVVSAFTYEARRETSSYEWPRGLSAVGERLEEIWTAISARERSLGIPPSRAPDPGFAEPIRSWASGALLIDVIGTEISVGDFVRNCRQLIDLLRQVVDGGHPGAPAARRAIEAIDRGVVAAVGIL
jgi:ATP-dependent RNA helicase HelY